MFRLTVTKKYFKGYYHLHFVSIPHVVIMSMQNRCTACSSETLRAGLSSSQPGTQPMFTISTPHPTGTAAGRPPCVFVLLCLSATRGSSGCGFSASANHGGPQVATEARQGGVLSVSGRGVHVRCVYLSLER